MKHCDCCNTLILFGGRYSQDESLVCCTPECLVTAEYAKEQGERFSNRVAEVVTNAKNDNCPMCKGDGPNDAYEMSNILSYISAMEVNKYVYICCKNCGRKQMAKSFVYTAFLGWWSIQGLFYTPFVLLVKLYRCCTVKAYLSPTRNMITYYAHWLHDEERQLRNEMAVQKEIERMEMSDESMHAYILVEKFLTCDELAIKDILIRHQCCADVVKVTPLAYGLKGTKEEVYKAEKVVHGIVGLEYTIDRLKALDWKAL